MSEEMSSFHVRVDQDFYDIIANKAKERGIKISRYIRMLLERGLVVDQQYHNEVKSIEPSVNDAQSLLSIVATLSAETTMLTRFIYRESFESDRDFEENAGKAYNKAQRLLELMKSNHKGSL